ncbi:MAG: DUF3380 domain-containing protein [Bryobacteraceae bacterium]|nr:DUF3380 domain-containing protein [Bryobacteraceae bacterium]
MITGIVTASQLNLRAGPSTSDRRLGSLPRGTTLEILALAGRWYRVRAGALEGFVHGDFIRLLDPNPASGFLKDRAPLLGVPLEPEEPRRLAPANGATARERLVIRVWNQQGGLIQPVTEELRLAAAAAVAVLCVESSGRSFDAGGRLIVRFESHVFLRQWGPENEAAFHAHFRFDPRQPWKKHEFRTGPDRPWESFHGDQDAEWKAFSFARSFSEHAALRSISMGGPQIMGFNFARLGYDSPGEMFDAFRSGARHQLLGFFDFVKGPGSTSAMLQALQRSDFAGFATLYNGPGQAAEYAERIEADVDCFRRLQCAEA